MSPLVYHGYGPNNSIAYVATRGYGDYWLWGPSPPREEAVADERVEDEEDRGIVWLLTQPAAFLFLRRRREQVGEAVGQDDGMRDGRKFSWSSVRPVVVKPSKGIIPWDDPETSARTRRHERDVAQILNSLLWQDKLRQTDEDVWTWGYLPGNQFSWSGTPPSTVGEAINRLAALAKTISGTGA